MNSILLEILSKGISIYTIANGNNISISMHVKGFHARKEFPLSEFRDIDKFPEAVKSVYHQLQYNINEERKKNDYRDNL